MAARLIDVERPMEEVHEADSEIRTMGELLEFAQLKVTGLMDRLCHVSLSFRACGPRKLMKITWR